MASTASFFGIPVIGSSVPSASADATILSPTHSVILLGGQGPRGVSDGVSNSTALITSASAAFNSGDVGRPISGSGIPTGAVIQYVVSVTNILIAPPAT